MPIAALLYFCTESRCLEITPKDKKHVLAAGSSLTLTCSGSGETTWELKSDEVPYFLEDQSHQIVQVSRTTSVLTLQNVNWRSTGVYQCKDLHTGEAEEVAIFVPGEPCFVYLWLND